MGVRSERRSEGIRYVYTVLNRSGDTLTSVELGFDPERGACALTGVPPHAVPDTCLSPEGWECGPAQTEGEPSTFCVAWKPAAGSKGGGILPGGMLSGFAVMLQRPDSLYERCGWLIRPSHSPRMGYGDALRPEDELELPSTDTGIISGKVTNPGGVGLAGALVFVKKSDLGALTGPDGTYRIPGVPVGARSLAVRAVGFEPCDKGRVRVAAKGPTRVDFRLAAAAPAAPCVSYGTAYERVRIPFPGDAVDTVGARFVDRRASIPEKPIRGARPQAFIQSLTSREISIVYPAIGQDTTRRAFVATVSRIFRNREEERLIRIAEETYPPPEAVLAVVDTRSGKAALAREKRLWWYGEFDRVRLPYAVTMDAVRYYLQLTQAFGRGDTTQTRGLRMKRSEFSYRAHISQRPETYSRDGRVFENVYVVEMRLSWSNYCGSLCACSFSLERTVVLRRDGTVLCVFGDQRPAVIVS